jgi:uncharacterized protein YkwD
MVTLVRVPGLDASGNGKLRVKILQERSTLREMIRVAVFVMVGLAGLMPAHAQISGNAAERQLFLAVNRTRRAQGLLELKWNGELAIAARRHAGLMAQHDAAEHGFAGEPSLATRVTQTGARFVWLAENVAQGPGVEAIDAEFLRSPNHRANILDSDMDSIGVGVVERGGRLFAVEDFSKAK